MRRPSLSDQIPLITLAWKSALTAPEQSLRNGNKENGSTILISIHFRFLYSQKAIEENTWRSHTGYQSTTGLLTVVSTTLVLG